MTTDIESHSTGLNLSHKRTNLLSYVNIYHPNVSTLVIFNLFTAERNILHDQKASTSMLKMEENIKAPWSNG